ncbi:MAG: DUF3604 domain-containing protein, partial [Gammaproteobacteria bacterium]
MFIKKYCPGLLSFVLASAGLQAAYAQNNPDQLLWGDVHLHTNLSWDAYYMGNQTAGPEVAYRFAKGLPVIHPFHRTKVKITKPLDFLAITDHSEFLGLPYSLIIDKDERMTSTRLGKHIADIYHSGGPGAEALVTMIIAFQTSLLPPPGSDEENAASRFPPPPPQVSQEVVDWMLANPDLWDEFFNRDVMRNNWELLIDAAERHYEPGKFTTLIGWEYSPQANGGNLHRVVLTPADGETAKKIRPFSFMDSDDPEDLWDWLEETSEATGARFVAIPHNSNLSKGTMFSRTRLNGEPIDKNYARQRAVWETVAEVTQMKGDSETHPLLSPDDEFADFEFFAHELASFKDDIKVPPVTQADYLRPALKTGLELEKELGVNPFKLGMIGSTDGHNALASTEEANFYGKFGEGTIPEESGNPVADFSGYTNWEFSSSGLAAVWARDNTREEVFAAFRRKEVYGTTGPRIGLRFFGGYRFSKNDARAKNLAGRGYAKGVPMGGDLLPSPRAKAPRFLIQAVKDPAGANLDRVQIIKGWLDENGAAHEKVFNVVWAGDRKPDSNGALPAVGDTVNRATADYSNDIGSAELTTVWIDPE